MYQVSKTAKPFKNLYKSQLLTKQKIKLYYTRLSDKQLKLLCKKANLKNKSLKNKKELDLLFYLLENRLDIIIFRSNIVKTIVSAKQIINHGHVYVNKKKVLNSNFLLKTGDLVEFSDKIEWLINLSVLSKKFNSVIPNYLEVNKTIFKFYYVTDLSFDKLLGFHPF